jgi:hypothetical protein
MFFCKRCKGSPLETSFAFINGFASVAMRRSLTRGSALNVIRHLHLCRFQMRKGVRSAGSIAVFDGEFEVLIKTSIVG